MFLFKWQFKSGIKLFNLITFPIRKLHVVFDIIKLSSHYEAKHVFYFLNAYGRHCKCGCLNNEQPLLWDRIFISTGHQWRTESTIYGKCRQKYLSRLLKYCVQNITLFDSPFLCAFISMTFCHDLLSSPKHFSHYFFSIFRGRWRTKFSTPKLPGKKKKEYLSYPYVAVSFSSKQNYILRTQG